MTMWASIGTWTISVFASDADKDEKKENAEKASEQDGDGRCLETRCLFPCNGIGLFGILRGRGGSGSGSSGDYGGAAHDMLDEAPLRVIWERHGGRAGRLLRQARIWCSVCLAIPCSRLL